MHRRDLLRYAAGGAALAIARRARADMAVLPPAVQVFAGVSMGAARADRTVLDVRTDGSRDFVQLGADLGAHDAHVFSADNANARFHVWTMILPVPKGSWAYLRLGSEMRMASSIGGGDGDAAVTTAVFELDDRTALRLAQQSGLTANIRLPLDGGLTYAWSNPGGAVRGKPVRIALRVTNGGNFAVRFAIGGRNEGPRDNRFSFAARRTSDGRAVAAREAVDFGGRMVRARLGPGEHVDVEADLRAWFDAPGAYELDCTYDGEVSGDTDDAGRWPEHGAEVWDVAPRGSLRVVVP